MHIAVAAKAVPDYEVPTRDFELSGNRAHSRYKRVIGLYDENAIEMGIQLKEKYGATLSIVSYGHSDDVVTLRKAVAMGGDSLYLVLGDSDDPYVIAANLKMALDRLPGVDLVLTGQQSSDMDRGIVHGILAGMLDWTFLAEINKIESDQDRWTVTQSHDSGSRVLQFSGKAVLSITSSAENTPRIPKVKAIMAAVKKPVEKFQEVDAAAMKVEEIKVEIPKLESVCEFLPLEDLQQTAKILLARLREERYL